MRAAHKVSRPGAAPQAVLASLMALLLLVASTLSVSHALHQSLHRDGTVSGHLCLVCSFAKGHASGPDAILVLVAAVLSVLFSFCLPQRSPLPRDFDFRVAQGRAPPAN